MRRSSPAKPEQIIDDLRRNFRRFRIRMKRQSTLMRVIDVVLRIITLGKMRSFLTTYTTTIGTTIYVPDTWARMSDEARSIILRHERVHLWQGAEYGWLWFSVLFLFCWPTIRTKRAEFEREAYEESLRAMAEYYGVSHIKQHSVREWLIRTFTGPGYFWMWPDPVGVAVWYEETVTQIEKDLAR